MGDEYLKMSIDSISAIINNLNLYTANTASGNNVSGSDSFSSILNSVSSGDKTTDLDQIFEKASAKYNVPVSLLKAIAKAESNFNADAVSSCGAQGIMQLMPGTAKSLGVTDSFDAEQNIMGGAKYLSQLLEQFNGNTEYAVAAYNAGAGNVTKYGGIPPFAETQNYVAKVMGYCGDDITAGTVSASTASDTTGTVNASEAWQLLLNMQLASITSNISSVSDSDSIADTILSQMLQYKLSQSLISNLNSTEEQKTVNI